MGSWGSCSCAGVRAEVLGALCKLWGIVVLRGFVFQEICGASLGLSEGTVEDKSLSSQEETGLEGGLSKVLRRGNCSAWMSRTLDFSVYFGVLGAKIH